MDLKQWQKIVKGYLCVHGHDTESVTAAELTELGDAIVECDRGHRWTVTAPSAAAWAPSRSGILSDLGVYDALVDVVASQPAEFHEYGIVEHRFAAANATLYRTLVERYGHTALQPKQYTASAALAGALGRLSAERAVEYADGPATGRWSYNGRVSHWAPAGTGKGAPLVSWQSYATANGIDPHDWPATQGLQHG